jgi:hypothetical protein
MKKQTLADHFDKLKAETGSETDTAFARDYLFGMTKSEYDKLRVATTITRAWTLLFMKQPGAMKKLRKWNEEDKQP